MCGSYYDLLVNKETSREHVEVNVQVDDNGDGEIRGQDVVVAVKLFTGFLNCGRLASPSQFAISLTKDVCYIYRWLWKEKVTRYALLGYTKPKAAIQKVIVTLGEEDDQLATFAVPTTTVFSRRQVTFSGSRTTVITTMKRETKAATSTTVIIIPGRKTMLPRVPPSIEASAITSLRVVDGAALAL
ncbi:hypothetical protein GWK47_043092 [Chionoecetes opilio]|uniref:Uncharacterized protein n=1 Tax=Chionoecetes opilio TaxID=41210 RepID=A0A8J4Y9R7_CHIOP|nr:hypothetical protein GWK47_043092 [Chionoecetes opilio]